jgi:hypothetical protein
MPIGPGRHARPQARRPQAGDHMDRKTGSYELPLGAHDPAPVPRKQKDQKPPPHHDRGFMGSRARPAEIPRHDRPRIPEALRAKERGEEAPPAFDVGQALEIIDGPLAGLMARFQRIIEDADGYHVEVDTDLTKKTRVSPAHVRKAG